MAGIRILLHFSFTNEGHLMNEQSSTEKDRERGNLNHTYIQLVRERAEREHHIMKLEHVMIVFFAHSW